jgi:hypothetical protein
MNLKTSSVEVPRSPKPEPQMSRKVAGAPKTNDILHILWGEESK